MSMDAALREALIEALRSPEAREAIREAVRGALPEVAPVMALPQGDEDELSLRQIKVQYGYSPDTVRGWIKAGLPAKKGPKEWRVRRADLKVKIGKSSGPSSVVDIEAKVDKILAGRRP